VSRWILRGSGQDSMDFILLAQGGGQWRDLVVIVMNLRVR
jgi:hypothetical protein